MIDWESYTDKIGYGDLTVKCLTNIDNVRYEYYEGDLRVAIVEFGLFEDTIIVPHLEVIESKRGMGIGSHIVAVSGYFYSMEGIKNLELRFISNRRFVEQRGFSADRNYKIDLSNPEEPFWAWQKTILGDN